MVKFISKQDESEIVAAIRLAESGTSGQIRVHLKKKCSGGALEEAARAFKKLGMHRTKHKNGVLIFVAPESRKFAIVGDSGIHEKLESGFWDSTRDLMARHFQNGEIKEGIVAGVLSAGKKLQLHFPPKGSDRNELTNTVTED